MPTLLISDPPAQRRPSPRAIGRRMPRYPDQQFKILEDIPRLEIGALQNAGCFIDAVGAQYRGSIGETTFIITKLDTVGETDTLQIRLQHRELHSHSCKITVTSSSLKFGKRRYFACPVTGRQCSHLYLVNGTLASRSGQGLRHASRTSDRRSRRRSQAIRVARRLAGYAGRGPARGQNRLELLQQAETLRNDPAVGAATRLWLSKIVKPKPGTKGRPLRIDEKMADWIVDCVAAGFSIRAICKLRGAPSESAVRRLCRTNPELCHKIQMKLYFRLDPILAEHTDNIRRSWITATVTYNENRIVWRAGLDAHGLKEYVRQIMKYMNVVERATRTFIPRVTVHITPETARKLKLVPPPSRVRYLDMLVDRAPVRGKSVVV